MEDFKMPKNGFVLVVTPEGVRTSCRGHLGQACKRKLLGKHIPNSRAFSHEVSKRVDNRSFRK